MRYLKIVDGKSIDTRYTACQFICVNWGKCSIKRQTRKMANFDSIDVEVRSNLKQP